MSNAIREGLQILQDHTKAKLIGNLIGQMDRGNLDAFASSEVLANTFDMELEDALDAIMEARNTIVVVTHTFINGRNEIVEE